MTIALRVGEDTLPSSPQRDAPTVELCVEVHELAKAEDIAVKLNGRSLTRATTPSAWIAYPVGLQIVRKGVNQVDVILEKSPNMKPALADLLLWVRYPGPCE